MSTFVSDHTDVFDQLARLAFSDSVEGLRHRDRLTLAMQEALQNGATFDELARVTGLTPGAIQRRVNGRPISDLQLVPA